MGCSPSTITRTAARDPEFAETLARTEAGLEIDSLRVIRQAAKLPKHWRAAVWMLTCLQRHEYALRRPDRYTQEDVVQIFTQFLAVLTPEMPAESVPRVLAKLENLLANYGDTDFGEEETESRATSTTAEGWANDAQSSLQLVGTVQFADMCNTGLEK